MKAKCGICFRISLVATLALNAAWGQTRQFQFEAFPAEVYHGRIHVPKWLHKLKDGEWVYISGTAASRPEVTFAGEYDLEGRTCGTQCRYYGMTDLRTGVDVPAIGMFDGAEPLPTTRDGQSYLTIHYFKPDSRLLIAEYLLNFREPDKPQSCRQRYFVLEDGKLKPISKTFMFCTEKDEP